jgi:uncharacterized membrane protein
MNKDRLVAFSDGVLAIIITIMVLELKVPAGDDLAALKPIAWQVACYVLSFTYIGIYWNNHHHMLHVTSKVSGGVLWANLHLLFWLSLVPFVTEWTGETNFAPAPTAVYGCVLFMAGSAYWILQSTILRQQGKDSLLAQALGKDVKGKMSPPLYLLAILCSFRFPWVAGALYALVALMWLVPDSRIERKVADNRNAES